jgi:hypothetical protein
VFGSCKDQQATGKQPAVQTKGNAIHGSAPRSSPDATTGPFAGLFEGDVKITGNLYVGNKLIAYPMAIHFGTFMAGTPMRTMHEGVVVLNANGAAVVELPKGFQDAHAEFRYQLTPIGAPAPNLHIAHEARGNKFEIRGGPGKLKVSWQVTGRVKAPRLVAKPAAEEPVNKRETRAAQAADGSILQIN